VDRPAAGSETVHKSLESAALGLPVREVYCCSRWKQQPSSGWRLPSGFDRFSMMNSRAEVSNRGNLDPSGFLVMAQKEQLPALVGSPWNTDEIDSEALERLFEAFVACRTTLDDLSSRAAAMGEDISGPVIAAHLTGKFCISGQKHNVVAAAINARLSELSMPAAAPYTNRFQGPTVSWSSALEVR
jgi:hypothetical protein